MADELPPKTNWTADQVRALEARYEAHTDDCDDCHDRWSACECLDSLPDDFEWCSIGESFMEDWLTASVEYSHQPNFAGDA